MTISIIVDGNNQLGMGHVYQSMTLSGFLKDATNGSADIEFITKSDDRVAALLRSTKCPVFQFDDDEQVFAQIDKKKPDLVIFDKLDVSPELASKIKNKINCKLVILTNLTEANRYADITVMAGMGSEFKNIHSKNPQTGQVQFWGPKYWLMRSEFYSYEKKQIKKIGEPNKILLIFGGADQANLSTAVLKEIIHLNRAKEVTVILGASFEHHSELELVIESNKNKEMAIRVLKSVSNVSELMYKSDLVFTSPGLSFFESLLVGTPVVCFHQNDFQKNAWHGFIQTLDKADIGRLESIVSEHDFIFPDDDNIKAMEIGMGKDEILNEILKSDRMKLEIFN